ncbi:hypothetical protein BZA70DRAFT_276882 [Myxozyma melibiosi]|uniref:Uncharacterized protein n=1 Tax=Myxozyma melibiosi TaxID=54550 RepID=A0ABR1F9A0_9ASCO
MVCLCVLLSLFSLLSSASSDEEPLTLELPTESLCRKNSGTSSDYKHKEEIEERDDEIFIEHQLTSLLVGYFFSSSFLFFLCTLIGMKFCTGH